MRCLAAEPKGPVRSPAALPQAHRRRFEQGSASDADFASCRTQIETADRRERPEAHRLREGGDGQGERGAGRQLGFGIVERPRRVSSMRSDLQGPVSRSDAASASHLEAPTSATPRRRIARCVADPSQTTFSYEHQRRPQGRLPAPTPGPRAAGQHRRLRNQEHRQASPHPADPHRHREAGDHQSAEADRQRRRRWKTSCATSTPTTSSTPGWRVSADRVLPGLHAGLRPRQEGGEALPLRARAGRPPTSSSSATGTLATTGCSLASASTSASSSSRRPTRRRRAMTSRSPSNVSLRQLNPLAPRLARDRHVRVRAARRCCSTWTIPATTCGGSSRVALTFPASSGPVHGPELHAATAGTQVPDHRHRDGQGDYPERPMRPMTDSAPSTCPSRHRRQHRPERQRRLRAQLPRRALPAVRRRGRRQQVGDRIPCRLPRDRLREDPRRDHDRVLHLDVRRR